MRRLFPAFVILLGCTWASWAASPSPINTLRAVHALSNAQASQALPVAFEATVTYYRNFDTDLFVQDGDQAIYVDFKSGANLLAGDRVLVQGKTRDSFRPIVVSESVTLLHHGSAPKPVSSTFEQLMRAQRDCVLVSQRGVVRAADMVWSAQKRNIYLQVLTDGGYIDAAVNSNDANALKELVDAEVEITGVATAKFDQKMQQTGATLDVQSLSDVKILHRPAASPAALPLTPMQDVFGGYHVSDLSHRVRVKGTVTSYEPGTAVVLQSGTQSLRIMTMSDVPLQVGDVAEASGFPEVRDGYLILTHGEVRDTQVKAPITPLPVNWWELGWGGNAFNLVTIEGQVVMQVREATKDEIVLVAQGHLFSAIYRHPDGAGGAHLPPMKQIPVGERVSVTGISMFYSSDPFMGPVASDLLLRSYDDIVLTAPPSWFTVRNLTGLVVLLLLVLGAAAARGWSVERKVNLQTAALSAQVEAEAYLQRQSALLERQRAQILEHINGTVPLAEIVEEITQMVSFRLDGDPCWCNVNDGARLGQYAYQTHDLRVISEQILARNGALLGVIHAGLEAEQPSLPAETDVLSVGAKLVALAIETRQLNDDLVHRSEFDLLTDVHNRFSLEKHVDALIEEARHKAGIFGLIYLDLDEFKQVNDVYGHQVGDMYLQEVALRMKRQLRSADMLARLGGDEFAALVPAPRSRAEVEEVALRLERCFDEPFAIEGYLLRGSASVGFALYPEDGATKDSLFSAADAGMYVAKHSRQQTT
ncbi:MAG: GGDEF domain-containing protein [Terracidiphilus sp.]|nr:GGDEF domain-containing protein [Terracidiphilus sp.]